MNAKQLKIRTTISKFIADKKLYDAVNWIVKQHPHSYFVMLKKPYCDKLLKDIQKSTRYLPNDADIGTRVWHYLNCKTSAETCATCGKAIRRIAANDTKQKHFCSNHCAQKDQSVQDKIASTKTKNGTTAKDLVQRQKSRMLEKYGVECAFQLESAKAKSRQTLLKHYGVEHQMKSAEVKDKVKATNLERYGTECTFSAEEVLSKIKAANQKKYGTDYPMQSAEVRKKMHEKAAYTSKMNYYRNAVVDSNFIPLFTAEEYASNKDKMKVFKWKCKTCGSIFESRFVWGNAEHIRCLKCNPFDAGTSGFEKDLASCLANALPSNYEVLNQKTENNMLIKPLQVDIIVKKDGIAVLAVEADGLYWHSDAAGKEKDYHLTKTKLCSSKGVQLVHVFEDEWKDSRDIVISRLLSILGAYQQKVYARNCNVVEVKPKDAQQFLDSNHLQGSCKSKVKLGLELDGELVALMTFGPRRKALGANAANGCWEMLRFCCKQNTHVIGGAGKLLKAFEKTCIPKELVSYADCRWSNGKLYQSLGFKLDHMSPPSYWYLDSRFSARHFRYEFRKSVLGSKLDKFDPEKTELQNMHENGWHVIWDCGNYVFKKQY